MTRQDRLMLANAARALASDVVEERGPQFDPGDFCECAVAHVVRRSGVVLPPRTNKKISNLAYDIDKLIFDDIECDYVGLVSKATIVQVDNAVPGAVVFPLLALADELEAA